VDIAIAAVDAVAPTADTVFTVFALPNSTGAAFYMRADNRRSLINANTVQLDTGYAVTLAGFNLHEYSRTLLIAQVMPDGGVSMAMAPVLNVNHEYSPVKHGFIYRIRASDGRVVRWQETLVPVNATIPGSSEPFPATSSAVVLAKPTGSPHELFRIVYVGDPTNGIIRLATLDGKSLYYSPANSTVPTLPCVMRDGVQREAYVLQADNATQHDLEFSLMQGWHLGWILKGLMLDGIDISDHDLYVYGSDSLVPLTDGNNTAMLFIPTYLNPWWSMSFEEATGDEVAAAKAQLGLA